MQNLKPFQYNSLSSCNNVIGIVSRLIPIFFITLLLLNTAAFSVEIHFYGSVPSGINRSFAEYEYKRIAKLIETPQTTDTHAIIVTFYKKSEIPQLGIRLPEWGGGGALGTDSIFIPIDIEYAFFRSDFQRILTHEMVHLIICRKYGNINIPRWFHEGMAMALSGEIDSDAPVVLSKAVLGRNLLSLDSIQLVNRFKRDRAHLAYCQSHFAVQFLMKQYGQDLLPELLSEIKKRSSFEFACIKVFGLSSDEINSIVNQKIRSEYHFSFLLDETFIWIIILILAVSGFIVTVVHKKKRMEEMTLEESSLELKDESIQETQDSD